MSDKKKVYPLTKKTEADPPGDSSLELKIARDALLPAIEKVKAIAAGKGIMPILGNVLIDLGTVSTVSASDLSVSAVRVISFSQSMRTRFLLPAALGYEVISKFDAGEIGIVITPEGITMKQGRGVYKFPYSDPEEFPEIPLIHEPVSASITGEDLHRVISKAAFAVGEDETRHVLTGLNLSISCGIMVAIGTDGHRLAKYCKSLSSEQSSPAVIIPFKTIKHLKSMIAEAEAVDITIAKEKIQFHTATLTIISRLIENKNYPDVSKVIPENKLTAVMKKEDVKRALKRVASMAVHGEALKIELKEKSCTISTASDAGEGAETLDCEYEGPDREFNFNMRFIPDVISRLDGEDVDIALPEGPGSIVIEEEDFTNLIMPFAI